MATPQRTSWGTPYPCSCQRTGKTRRRRFPQNCVVRNESNTSKRFAAARTGQSSKCRSRFHRFGGRTELSLAARILRGILWKKSASEKLRQSAKLEDILPANAALLGRRTTELIGYSSAGDYGTTSNAVGAIDSMDM